MVSNISRAFWLAGAIVVIASGAFFLNNKIQTQKSETKDIRSIKPVPIEVAEVQRGPLSLIRTFSGSIEPRSQFSVAPKISGKIRQILVDVSDQVDRGQLVVEMEDAEFKQAVLEAEARLAVAEANNVEAVSRLVITQRELERTKTLYNRGIASESDFDNAKSSLLASQAAEKVASANIKREKAMLLAARIRLGYTKIQAEWQHGYSQRTVAERFVDEGNTVAANTPLLSIVEIDPVIAVIQVTEKDYPLLRLGQKAIVITDAFPRQDFSGAVTRISPIFRKSSRQARIEIEIANPDQLLKPGMFSRCTLELKKENDAISVPLMALTERNNQSGVFKVKDDDSSVEWIPVQQGFQSGNQIQLLAPALSGLVVTVGQQFIKDGTSVSITGKSMAPDGGSELR